jgi:hypothetical protein
MYYQYEWNPYIIDPSSSYMSEFDSFGAGSYNFLFVSGQESEIFGRDLDANVGLALNDPAYDHSLDQLLRFLPTNYRQIDFNQDGLLEDYEYVGCAPDDDNTSKCRVLTQEHYKTITPSNTGQFGIATHFFLEDGSELGFYYVNYHEKIPNFVLPIDAIDSFAPIIDVLLYAADPQHYKDNNINFEGVTSINGDLSNRQITMLLTFMDAVPETDGSVNQLVQSVVNDPDVLNAVFDQSSIDQIKNLTDIALAEQALYAIGYAGADWYLKQYGFNAQSEVRSINYRVQYLENTHILATTYSTLIGDANVAAEFTYRPNAPLMRGDVPRTIDRRQLLQLHLNSLMVLPPTMFWDFSSLVIEGLIWHVPNGEEYDVNDLNNKKRLAVQNSPQGLGVSAFWTWEYQSILSGWDLAIPWYVNWGVDGAMVTSGYRDGQVTFATGATMKNTAGLELGLSVATMFGDQDDVFQISLQDRDNVSIFMKYAF